MKDHENTLKNHENHAKIVKNENIETHRQRLWRPNNCISSDVQKCVQKTSVSPKMCPKNIGITSLRKEDHRPRIATKIWLSIKSSRDQNVNDDNHNHHWCHDVRRVRTGILMMTITHNHQFYPARALRALGLLLADGAPIVGGGKTFWAVSRIFLRKQL